MKATVNRNTTAFRHALRSSCRRTAVQPNGSSVCFVITYQGATPFDALDRRVAEAMAAATVRRLPGGTYRAETPKLELFYSDGATKREALSELREEARWLLADPVRMTFSANGREYVAEVKAERRGGYSAVVPALPGCCTCGETMDSLRGLLVEAAEGWLAAEADVEKARA